MNGATHNAAKVTALAEELAALLDNGCGGLPEPVFRLVSQLTPMVNVDLLIRDHANRTLLTWRADEFYGPGWHIPGGIIRFKENAADRIAAVAEAELGARVVAEKTPCRITEIMAPHRDLRGHFISLLYRCVLQTPPDRALKFSGSVPKNGEWCWFAQRPDNMIPVHTAVYHDCFVTDEAAN